MLIYSCTSTFSRTSLVSWWALAMQLCSGKGEDVAGFSSMGCRGSDLCFGNVGSGGAEENVLYWSRFRDQIAQGHYLVKRWWGSEAVVAGRLEGRNKNKAARSGWWIASRRGGRRWVPSGFGFGEQVLEKKKQSSAWVYGARGAREPFPKRETRGQQGSGRSGAPKVTLAVGLSLEVTEMQERVQPREQMSLATGEVYRNTEASGMSWWTASIEEMNWLQNFQYFWYLQNRGWEKEETSRWEKKSTVMWKRQTIVWGGEKAIGKEWGRRMLRSWGRKNREDCWLKAPGAKV